MRLDSKLIFLYDLIFDVAILHIQFLLNWYLPLILNVIQFSCLEKLELVLKLIVSLIFQMLHLLPLSTQMVLFSF